ncbi:MAG: hypothetical protein HUJ42_03205 [Malacoplasma sp.]|nr:hypothetical protein [Malacoplasma sp.]
MLQNLVLNLIDNTEYESIIQKSQSEFIEALNNNEYGILDLIKLDLQIHYNTKINYLKILQIEFSKTNLNLVFEIDESVQKNIYDTFLKNEASCESDASKNFNKFKISKYFSLPVDFEIKLRTFEMYRDYLLSSLKDNIVDKIIFDYYKEEWQFVKTVYHAYMLYRDHILNIDKNQKQVMLSQIKMKFNNC